MVATIKNKTYCESSLVDMQNYFDQLGKTKCYVYQLFQQYVGR